MERGGVGRRLNCHRCAVQQIEDQLPVRVDESAARLDFRIPRGITVLLQQLAQLRQGDSISLLQPDVRGGLVERHLRRLDAWKFHQRHTHGVGTDLSIHAQHVQLHVAQFRHRRGGGEQQHRENGGGKPSHQSSRIIEARKSSWR